jgi:hypothetical protein
MADLVTYTSLNLELCILYLQTVYEKENLVEMQKQWHLLLSH